MKLVLFHSGNMMTLLSGAERSGRGFCPPLDYTKSDKMSETKIHQATPESGRRRARSRAQMKYDRARDLLRLLATLAAVLHLQ